MSAKTRAPYCTGCGTLFPKMHLMMQHRRLKKCGGRFLPEKEQRELLAVKNIREFIKNSIQVDMADLELLDNHLLVLTLLRSARLQRVT